MPPLRGLIRLNLFYRHDAPKGLNTLIPFFLSTFHPYGQCHSIKKMQTLKGWQDYSERNKMKAETPEG